jgi:predicted Zn-dependent protease with MMP-like domain
MSTWQDLLDDAEIALRELRHHDALQLCDRAAVQGDDARYFSALLRGDVLLDFGDAAGALSSYDSVADPGIADPELDLCRGLALFELVRFAEAENALRSALRGDPSLAEAHYTLALIAEINGTGREVEHFRQARRLDPDRFPAMPQMSRNEFEAVVEEALASLPESVREATRGIPVLIAEVVHPGDLMQADPPFSPRILGMFVGIAPRDVSVLDAPPEQQPTILLFKRNLERACPDREVLIAEVRKTVLHEVGHALGLSEEELVEMGLE